MRPDKRSAAICSPCHHSASGYDRLARSGASIAAIGADEIQCAKVCTELTLVYQIDLGLILLGPVLRGHFYRDINATGRRTLKQCCDCQPFCRSGVAARDASVYEVNKEKPKLDRLGFVDIALEGSGCSLTCQISGCTWAGHELGRVQNVVQPA